MVTSDMVTSDTVVTSDSGEMLQSRRACSMISYIYCSSGAKSTSAIGSAAVSAELGACAAGATGATGPGDRGDPA